jgi:hypothetical protein
MAQDDFYMQSAQRQWDALEAQRMRELADLQAAKAAGDEDSAAASILGIANIDAAKRNLAQLTNDYAASQNPPAPPPVSKEQRAARRWDEMDGQDLLDIARTSRHAKDLTWNDPNVRAGWAEAQRRRARGE